MAIEKLIRDGGYNQKEVPSEYEEVVEKDPERQKAVDILVAEIPDTIELKDGRVELLDSTVLDLGAGTGIVTNKIKDRAGRVIALDQAEAMVSHLRERFSDSENVKAVVGDMTEMPLADNSVEVIVSAGAIRELPVVKDGEIKIEELEDDFLRELMRVLKPGGMCMLDSIKNAKNDYVIRLFSKQREEELGRYDGFKGDRVVQRENIFLTEDMTDQEGNIVKGIGSRLKDLGFDCEVETIFDKEGSQQSSAVKIKLLNKS